MTNAEADRVRVILTEIYALDLARVLRHAIAGDSFWRFEARKLLRLIDEGVPPLPPPGPGERQPQPQHQEAA